MKTKIIIYSIILSGAIWFAVNWLMWFIGIKDYGFISSMIIVVVWYIAIELIKIINNMKTNNMKMADEEYGGYLVRHANGKTGRTHHAKGLINGKVPVYFDGEKIAVLCSKEKLTVIGFID